MYMHTRTCTRARTHARCCFASIVTPVIEIQLSSLALLVVAAGVLKGPFPQWILRALSFKGP